MSSGPNPQPPKTSPPTGASSLAVSPHPNPHPHSPLYPTTTPLTPKTVGIAISAILCCFCQWPFKQLDQNQAGIIIQHGHIHEVENKNLYFINPLTEKFISVDLSVKTREISQKSFDTPTGSVRIAPVISFRVANPSRFLSLFAKVQDAEEFVTTLTLSFIGVYLAISSHGNEGAVEKLRRDLFFITCTKNPKDRARADGNPENGKEVIPPDEAPSSSSSAGSPSTSNHMDDYPRCLEENEIQV
ncbi:hypothetical protein BO94DRAFT_607754 [Aspergillus sclerotioniger CBS 115572]|uniref:Band 7 domain-containing protein n=1 Tax=Aspergillus sclerotioniger CBS 115572 TaxID=1450535 RepID=A0A317VIB8_9EURO|nr:hypothetical protein BO94DRAFT_607754 [Aspergillus sclerotioniger CBS 115572]PWY73199.1 hypothetical protein BO94DRAFT_607754 [Aspergillus sclerotioniger CBS 115572]